MSYSTPIPYDKVGETNWHSGLSRIMKQTFGEDADGRNILNTDFYIGNAIIDNGGKVFRINTIVGYGDVNFTGGADVLERYYTISDWLGNVRAMEKEDANVEMAKAYYPYGLEMPSRVFISEPEAERYQFQAHERDQEVNYDFHGARYYSPMLGNYMSVDPLAHVAPGWSPYRAFYDNPINFTDPTGALDNPIYGTDGEFLGTDDKGLQGEAIVMDKGDFTQGMSHSDALNKGTIRSEMPLVTNPKIFDKIDNHFAGLPSRPDYDGKLTLGEANEWFRTGEGTTLFTDLGQLNLNMLNKNDFPNGVGRNQAINLLPKGNVTDGLVYGTLTFKLHANDIVTSIGDNYGFEMQAGRTARNAATRIGAAVAGEGTPFDINFYGKGKIGKPFTPKFPTGPNK